MKERRTATVVVEDLAIAAGGLGFDSRVGQIGHSRQQLATAAMFLCCCPGAKPRRSAPALAELCGAIPGV